jgi:hypothetical protein
VTSSGQCIEATSQTAVQQTTKSNSKWRMKRGTDVRCLEAAKSQPSASRTGWPNAMVPTLTIGWVIKIHDKTEKKIIRHEMIAGNKSARAPCQLGA